MHVLFVGGVFAQENLEEITRESRRPVEYSANLFQEKLIDGFRRSGCDVRVVSAPFIGSYPDAYGKFWFSGFEKGQDRYRYVSFCNVWGIRNFSRYRALKKEMDSFIRLEDTEKMIVVYSVHTPFLQAAVYARSKDPRIRICLVVPDLPQYMNLEEHQSLLYRVGKRYDIRKFNRLNRTVDSYVLLTGQMTEMLDVHGCPYMVLEGIVSASELADVRTYVPQDPVRNILYAGKLNQRFGVRTLVDAFSQIRSPDLRLIVCGKGELESYVRTAAGKDKRIIYKGQVTPDEVKELIMTSDLLVNPRPDNEVYTRYSFPSKNIEYLLSGKPVLGYRLDGMPEVYGSFMMMVREDPSRTPAENLRLSIESALAVDAYDNLSFIRYVKENLSAEVAVARMMELTMGVKETISIITPCCNSEPYLRQTIESVLDQTWSNWEMLIVDDCSSDRSAEMIREYCGRDPRIRYFRTDARSGSPTVPRNIAVENARGRYIAFLDSDDLWLPTKLEEQIKVFRETPDASIVFSYYEKMTEEGVRSGRVVTSPSKVTYDRLLYGNVIGCLTGMYDTGKVGKVYMKPVGHEDYAMWLEILKKGHIGVNTCNVQALYRVRKGSVSSNKLKALKWQWDIYREQEKLNMFKALCCFVAYCFKAVLKAL